MIQKNFPGRSLGGHVPQCPIAGNATGPNLYVISAYSKSLASMQIIHCEMLNINYA
jgi:hypothetical protein